LASTAPVPPPMAGSFALLMGRWGAPVGTSAV
jgi:hypothetical protein